MINDEIFKIKQDKMLYEYLKYHSYWYELIKKNSLNVKEMIKEMKIELKQTPIDKIKDLNKKIELLSSFINLIN